jgi:hypothetical protein
VFKNSLEGFEHVQFSNCYTPLRFGNYSSSNDEYIVKAPWCGFRIRALWDVVFDIEDALAFPRGPAAIAAYLRAFRQFSSEFFEFVPTVFAAELTILHESLPRL